jgi:hypothetical protein
MEKAESTKVTAATADRRTTSHGTARDRQGFSHQHGMPQTVIQQSARRTTSSRQPAAGSPPHAQVDRRATPHQPAAERDTSQRRKK